MTTEQWAQLNQKEIELELEKMHPEKVQKRAKIYTYLRQAEGFSDEELAMLDKYTVDELGPASRSILVLRAAKKSNQTESREEEEVVPPYVPAHQSVATPPSDDDEFERLKQEAMRIARDKSVSKTVKDHVRREFIKAALRPVKKAYRSRV